VVAGAPRDRGRDIERALDRDVVDLRGEYFLEVIILLHAGRIAKPRSRASTRNEGPSGFVSGGGVEHRGAQRNPLE
jgi:hypothetical protein